MYGPYGTILIAQQAEPEGGLFGALLVLAVVVLSIAGLWATFSKAGRPGWASIIPIYNLIVLLQVAGRPVWWIILMFVPIVNIVITIVVAIDVARNFGKGAGFGIGLWLLPVIFYPILGFGSAQYRGS